MALDATKWRVNTNKSIDYIGGDHGTATANYVTVLELHRWLMDIADDSSVADHGADDYMDITTLYPSDKSFDTIINLVNGYYLNEGTATPAVEFVYGGSIIQNPGTGEQFYDGIKVVANQGIKVNVIQNNAVLTNDFWNSVPNGDKTAATATVGTGSTGTNVVVSSTTEFAAGDTIMFGTVVDEEYIIDSITDATNMKVTETLTTAPSNADAIYFSTRGINKDAANGVAMQFMVKTKTAGAAVDNGTLLFTTREWFKTFSEFRIPSTGRGENVVPLAYADDLNNTTPIATVSTWTTIENTGQFGFQQIDVNQDSTNEDYISQWNRDIYTINQFYEYMKYVNRAGETGTTNTYGLAGELYRGVTHSIEFTAAATPSDFADLDTLYWDTDGSTAKVLAYDSTNNIAYVQLLTGVVPGDSETLYTAASQTGNSAATLASNGTLEKTISTPHCGASTGSSLVGAYGFTLEYADLAVNDKIQALDGITRSPPNNVSFSVGGVEHDFYVLVGPENGSGGLAYDQLSNDALLNGAAVTSVVVTEAIPANTPTTGTIRIERADGQYTRHPYSAVNTGTRTFTITSHDFSTNNASAAANVFISYVDDVIVGTTVSAGSFVTGVEYEIKTVGTTDFTLIGASASTVGIRFVATGAGSGTGDAYRVPSTVSYNTVQTTTQTLYIEARYGGTAPNYEDSIKPASTTGTLGTTGGSATLSPVSDA